ncbi:hypothetical protein SH203_00028 [Brevundimonas sp. SH203]|uniref:DUF58 domain-containing protein n=1 Tax=Brevundimonas sp. SH203 TaxID=345167 RepID=UPI0009CA2AE2|nr:DUF58 domain-containing protein [Brevundimonas sp. SH203]GAW39653.1 hypothetical protein SH203_00028 [Brevundimonas sp. SH203]
MLFRRRQKIHKDAAPDALAAPLDFETLFDPGFLAALTPFSLRIARAQKGGRLAEQRTNARGQGSEFADFKPYVAGDDLRAIDWNVYRRLGRVFVRVFEESQDMPVYFLMDRSRSLYVETPPRIHAAQQAALALAAVALDQHDSVGFLPFSDTMAVEYRGVSGKASLARIAHSLAAHTAGNGTGLAAALTHLASLRFRQGLVVVVSDFFDEAGIESVVRALEGLPHRLLLVQLVKAYDAAPERHPDLTGDVLMDDGEGDPTSVTLTPDVVARYRTAYAAFDEALTGFARSRGAGLARIDVDVPVLDQLAGLFEQGAARL